MKFDSLQAGFFTYFHKNDHFVIELGKCELYTFYPYVKTGTRVAILPPPNFATERGLHHALSTFTKIRGTWQLYKQPKGKKQYIFAIQIMRK